MNNLKEKFFAFFVVLALAVIFIPMLFKDSDEKVNIAKELPPAPQIKEENGDFKKPESVAQLEKNNTDDTTSEEDHEIKEEQIFKTPPLDASKKEVKPKEQAIEPSIKMQPIEEKPVAQIDKQKEKKEEKKEEKKPILLEKSQSDSSEKPIETSTVKALPKLNEDKIEVSQKVDVSKKETEKNEQAQPFPNIKEEKIYETVLINKNEGQEKKEIVKKKRKQKEITGKGWTIQMGTFAFEEHAITLMKKLKKAGYPAYARKKTDGYRELTLIFVGPQARKEESLEIKKILEEKFHLCTEIKRYFPSL